jgi:hypothetical protein
MYCPYVSGEVRMDLKTEVCLYPCGGAACAPTAMGGISPESQFSWLSGRYPLCDQARQGLSPKYHGHRVCGGIRGNRRSDACDQDACRFWLFRGSWYAVPGQSIQATARSLVNPIKDGKSKYLHVHYHSVWERITSREFKVERVKTGCMLANLFAKRFGSIQPG